MNKISEKLKKYNFSENIDLKTFSITANFLKIN